MPAAGIAGRRGRRGESGGRPGAFSLKRAPVLSMVIIGAFVFAAIFANVLTVYSPTEPSIERKLLPPFWMTGGSLAFPLGTDLLGRDILTRIIYGSRVSLTVSMMTFLFAGCIGCTVGLVSGYKGGWVDAVLMRIVDAIIALPLILVAVVLVVVLGAGLWNVVLAVGLMNWTNYARVVRGEVLSLKRRDFIAQAQLAGCSVRRILLVHLFPNILNTLMIMLTIQVGRIIMIEASLSFLGAGVPPPAPAWGQMVADGRDYVTTAWWVTLWPGLAIMGVVMSLNFFGDWLRDTLDPRLRQV